MKQINLKEAVESIEQLKARISSLEQAYENRKTEVEDDEYWKDVPRGAKLAILSKLDTLQRDLDKAKKKLKRLEVTEVVVEDELPGGIGDDAKVSDFSPEQISTGLKVEMEHTNDPKIALEIVLDHLTEDSEYYTKLATIESEPEIASSEIVAPEKEMSIDPELALNERSQLQVLVQQLENFIITSKAENTLADELKEALSKLKNVVEILDKESSFLFQTKEDEDKDDIDYVVTREDEPSEEEHITPLIEEEVEEVILEPEATKMVKSILTDILANKIPYIIDSTTKFPYIIEAEPGDNQEPVEILLGFNTKEYGKHFDGWVELKYVIDYSYTPARTNNSRDTTPESSDFELNSVTIESIQFYNDTNSENYFLSLGDVELKTLAEKVGNKIIDVSY